jgi:hypothetical protein
MTAAHSNIFSMGLRALGIGTTKLPLLPSTITGSTGIDDSVQTETTTWQILEIAPATGAPLTDVKVIFDLNKATDGFGVVETSATIAFQVARKVDGTNWRGGPVSATTSGTVAAVSPGKSFEVTVGDVDVASGCRIYATMSADATADMVLPYIVQYKGLTAPTVTGVTNG